MIGVVGGGLSWSDAQTLLGRKDICLIGAVFCVVGKAILRAINIGGYREFARLRKVDVESSLPFCCSGILQGGGLHTISIGVVEQELLKRRILRHVGSCHSIRVIAIGIEIIETGSLAVASVSCTKFEPLVGIKGEIHARGEGESAEFAPRLQGSEAQSCLQFHTAHGIYSPLPLIVYKCCSLMQTWHFRESTWTSVAVGTQRSIFVEIEETASKVAIVFVFYPHLECLHEAPSAEKHRVVEFGKHVEWTSFRGACSPIGGGAPIYSVIARLLGGEEGNQACAAAYKRSIFCRGGSILQPKGIGQSAHQRLSHLDATIVGKGQKVGGVFAESAVCRCIWVVSCPVATAHPSDFRVGVPGVCPVFCPSQRECIAVERAGLHARISPRLSIIEMCIDDATFSCAETFAQ